MERQELEFLVRARKTGQALARRAWIVLAAADGEENKTIRDLTGAYINTVGKWRRQFAIDRLDGLYDEPRPETPRDAMHWSLRSMARAVGYAPSTIHRIWKVFGLQPHRTETFKLSSDPVFVEKVRDIVGLYMAPPEHARVLCVDEKSQIQALDRSQPMLPIRRGKVVRRTHD
ncbi:helix-turn-helix domain-containing protein [Gluconacetobacter asukensis]|uniref:helix-turn-helix domain-containing protein n=1 Tax=Gluconacetobacter asukensis TaxID=1017181 RepID=UPI00160136F9|nr:helix-turn-helix domain-containing protein [Gluconacetobacter asukensis]